MTTETDNTEAYPSLRLAQAKAAANRLLREKRLSKWNTGFLRAITLPPARVIEIISRLVKQHDLNTESTYEDIAEKRNDERG
jgi:hypothetical protein